VKLARGAHAAENAGTIVGNDRSLVTQGGFRGDVSLEYCTGTKRSPIGLQWLDDSTLMATADPLPPADPIFARLQEQQSWYSQKSREARKAFKFIKVTEIVAAALIPFLTGHVGTSADHGWPGVNYVIGGLGVLITILEGLLHLNQYQEHWTSYRATSEALKHEKFMFQAKAGPYANAVDPRVALAERIEAVMSQENSQWVSTQQKATTGQSSTGQSPTGTR